MGMKREPLEEGADAFYLSDSVLDRRIYIRPSAQAGDATNKQAIVWSAQVVAFYKKTAQPAYFFELAVDEYAADKPEQLMQVINGIERALPGVQTKLGGPKAKAEVPDKAPSAAPTGAKPKKAAKADEVETEEKKPTGGKKPEGAAKPTGKATPKGKKAA